MKTPLQKIKEQHPDLVTEEMLKEELELLRLAYRSGWMRANALNYDDIFFDNFLFSNDIK